MSEAEIATPTVTKKKATAKKATSKKASTNKKAAVKKAAPAETSKTPTKKKTSAKKAPAKKAASKKAASPAKGVLLPIEFESLVSLHAYLKSQQRGFAPGNEGEDWAAAEQEISARFTVTERL